MKSIAKNLKTKEHQHALLTVAVISLFCTLLFLLVSLESPINTETNEAITLEVYDFEIASSITQPVQSEQPNTQTEESVAITTKTETIINEEEKTLNYLGFESNQNSVNMERFGKDGLDEMPVNFSTKIAKRTIINPPTFNADTQEEGTIGLTLWVDASGRVVEMRLNPSASNSGSAFLIDLAKKAAKTMRFESKPGTAIECVGTTIFAFKKA